MPEISITIRGLDELVRELGDDGLVDDLLRPGFKKSGVIVEGAARGNVHTVTRKLQGSLGHDLTGAGASLEAHIGTQPGLGQPRGYSASDTGRWRKPRRGKNTGDPQVYGRFEEEGTRYRPGHPFLRPALHDNIDRIGDVIGREAEAALKRRFR